LHNAICSVCIFVCSYPIIEVAFYNIIRCNDSEMIY